MKLIPNNKMNLFYAPDIKGDTWMLSEEESRHLLKVLRLQTGDRLNLTDGRGGLYSAVIDDISSRQCRLLITDYQPDHDKRDFLVHLAVAPTKNIDRYEWFLEKSTEIGVDVISPMICSRSERRIIKTERLNRVITSAMKQSLKTWHPVLNELASFQDLSSSEFDGDKFIAHCGPGARVPLHSITKPGGSSLVLIGPEGDFTGEEILLAEEKGFVSVSLGDSRLRTETAAVIACHTISLINGMAGSRRL